MESSHEHVFRPASCHDVGRHNKCHSMSCSINIGDLDKASGNIDFWPHRKSSRISCYKIEKQVLLLQLLPIELNYILIVARTGCGGVVELLELSSSVDAASWRSRTDEIYRKNGQIFVLIRPHASLPSTKDSSQEYQTAEVIKIRLFRYFSCSGCDFLPPEIQFWYLTKAPEISIAAPHEEINKLPKHKKRDKPRETFRHRTSLHHS